MGCAVRRLILLAGNFRFWVGAVCRQGAGGLDPGVSRFVQASAQGKLSKLSTLLISLVNSENSCYETCMHRTVPLTSAWMHWTIHLAFASMHQAVHLALPAKSPTHIILSLSHCRVGMCLWKEPIILFHKWIVLWRLSRLPGHPLFAVIADLWAGPWGNQLQTGRSYLYGW